MEIAQRNETQLRASDPKESAWVSAHAGSGKTFILIDRLVRLLLDGVSPERILCITFTKAAATEMSARLYEKLGAWALATDKDLQEELLALEGVQPDEAKVKKARNLFSNLLETQNRNHIQTIHSFCQSVLKRFPIEANIQPNFQTIDDYTRNALLEQARLDVLNDGRTNQEAIKIIAQTISSANFEKIFSEITNNRKKIEAMIIDYPQKLKKLAAAWELEENETHEAIRQKIITERPAAMKQDFSTLNHIDDYIDVFMTKTGTPRKNIEKKGGALATEQIRVANLIEKAKSAQALKFTHAFLQITSDFLEKFKTLKQHQGLLDYDDLIYKTLDLFEDRAAGQWVLYRLDGGIDHILIDEAQDTNPEQWQLIQKLSEEFFAGESYKERPCSLFVVGDAKQSIFGFQGAAPDGFATQQAFFAARAQEAQKPFNKVDLSLSFRSTPQLLSVIDDVLAELDLSENLTEHPPHKAFRKQDKGSAEVWELFTPQKDETTRADERLAENIAYKIETLLEEKDIEAKDILILLRRRNKFVDILTSKLRARRLAVAGADRLVLADELAVQDLLSLAKWVLLPQDNLALAEVLKSPLCGLSEADLMNLALGRGDKSLWQSLTEKQNQWGEVFNFLTECLQWADFISVFDFFSKVLETKNMRSHFVSLMGDSVHDPLDAFLNLALTYEESHTPSLQGFIEWFSSTQAEIKRDMERANKIRIMTIHSAKGLESKVVFFVDIPSRSPTNYFLPIEDTPFFRLPEMTTKAIEEAKEQERAIDMHEQARLLYVALTRARDRLYICSFRKKGDSQPLWHDLIKNKVPQNFISVQSMDSPKMPKQKPTPKSSTALPIFLIEKITLEKNTKRKLNPSLLSYPDSKKILSPLEEKPAAASAAATRGTMLHEALRYGTKLGYQALTSLLQEKFAQHPDCADLADLALALIGNPTLAEIFKPKKARALDEVPLQANLAGAIFSGKIDRLLLDEANKTALIIDYKSDAQPPPPEILPQAYQEQLASYSLMIGRIYPDWLIKAGLLWTSIPRLDWMSEKTLEKQKKEVISKIGKTNGEKL